jgi:excisionase family DNA binding protein
MDHEDSNVKVLLKPEEAARRLSVSRTQVYDLIRTGRLESIKVGRLRRVPVVALQRFVQSEQACRD